MPTACIPCVENLHASLEGPASQETMGTSGRGACTVSLVPRCMACSSATFAGWVRRGPSRWIPTGGVGCCQFLSLDAASEPTPCSATPTPGPPRLCWLRCSLVLAAHRYVRAGSGLKCLLSLEVCALSLRRGDIGAHKGCFRSCELGKKPVMALKHTENLGFS